MTANPSPLAPPSESALGTSSEEVLDRAFHDAVEALDLPATTERFREQNHFIALDRFVPDAVVEGLLRELAAVRGSVHRSYIPRHKKGGSVSHYTLRERAPATMALYHGGALRGLIEELAGVELQPCPPDDPHAAALYVYTEAGDHIGWHRDTSYYRGARYTVLIGLIERSTSRLECRVHADDPDRPTEELALATEPGTLIAFHGDRLPHRVTPLGEGEERAVLTLEYVTDARMGRFRRFISNMKDAIAYFGFGAVWSGRLRRDGGSASG